MKCPACQTESANDSRFCTGCGAEFGRVAAAPSTGNWQTRLQVALLLFIAVLLGAVVLQNVYLTRSVKHLLDSVTIAAVPPTMSDTHGAHDAAAESPNAAMVFAALRTPCGKCNKLLAENDCEHANGARSTKKLINQMFHDGKSIHEVIGYFVERFGEGILSEQALAIYKQKRAANAR